MRKPQPVEGQASLFDAVSPRKGRLEKVRSTPATTPSSQGKTWRMPAAEGRTVAEVRLRWQKRLTPAQVARVEQELSALPRTLTKLGFGPVEVEHVFVRRRRLGGKTE